MSNKRPIAQKSKVGYTPPGYDMEYDGPVEGQPIKPTQLFVDDLIYVINEGRKALDNIEQANRGLFGGADEPKDQQVSDAHISDSNRPIFSQLTQALDVLRGLVRDMEAEAAFMNKQV